MKRVPAAVRDTIHAYLNLFDWRHIQEGGSRGNAKDWSTSSEFVQWREKRDYTSIPSEEVGERIKDLIHEPSSLNLLEELEEVKELLNKETPKSWLQKTSAEELWEEEHFQQGDIPIPPGLQTVWDQLSLFLGQQEPVTGKTIRDWRLSLTKKAKECPGSCLGFLRATCVKCGQPKCGIRHCTTFREPCGTCQTIPISAVPEPPPESTTGKTYQNDFIT